MKARVVSFDDCKAMVNKGAKTLPHTNHSLINMSSALSALKAQDCVFNCYLQKIKCCWPLTDISVKAQRCVFIRWQFRFDPRAFVSSFCWVLMTHFISWSAHVYKYIGAHVVPRWLCVFKQLIRMCTDEQSGHEIQSTSSRLLFCFCVAAIATWEDILLFYF